MDDMDTKHEHGQNPEENPAVSYERSDLISPHPLLDRERVIAVNLRGVFTWDEETDGAFIVR